MAQFGSEWRDYKPDGTTTKPKRSKYNARPHFVLPDLRILPADECGAVPGIRFASKREADRFVTLRHEQERGLVTDLELQPAFPLHAISPVGVKIQIGCYVADYRYMRQGRPIVEDVKGVKTPLYQRSKRHVEAEYGIRILET